MLAGGDKVQSKKDFSGLETIASLWPFNKTTPDTTIRGYFGTSGNILDPLSFKPQLEINCPTKQNTWQPQFRLNYMFAMKWKILKLNLNFTRPFTPARLFLASSKGNFLKEMSEHWHCNPELRINLGAFFLSGLLSIPLNNQIEFVPQINAGLDLFKLF